MSRVYGIALAASLSLFPTVLAAQRCMGEASFADRRAQIAADASFSAGGRSVTGGLGVGSPRGPFASIGLGVAHNDDVNDEATAFAATAGVEFPIQPGPKTQLCPFISAVVVDRTKARGQILISGFLYDISHVSVQTYGLGMSLGTVLSSVTAFELVPFASAAVIARNTTIYAVGPGADPTEAEGDHYYAVSFGAGGIVRKLITFRPAVTLTFGDGQTNALYGVHLSVGFGRVRHQPAISEGEGSLTTVWVNARTSVYYCPGATSYGATPEGAFMTEREALAAGAMPAYGKRC
jgi:hypothetical protein